MSLLQGEPLKTVLEAFMKDLKNYKGIEQLQGRAAPGRLYSPSGTTLMVNTTLPVATPSTSRSASARGRSATSARGSSGSISRDGAVAGVLAWGGVPARLTRRAARLRALLMAPSATGKDVSGAFCSRVPQARPGTAESQRVPTIRAVESTAFEAI